jgi:hypothetical protein
LLFLSLASENRGLYLLAKQGTGEGPERKKASSAAEKHKENKIEGEKSTVPPK